MDCEQAVNLIPAYIDGELDTADVAAVEAHLGGCAACRAVLDALAVQDAALVRAFARNRRAAESAADRALEAFAAWAPDASRSIAPPAVVRAPRGGSRFWAPLAAAAAGFALAFTVRAWIDRPDSGRRDRELTARVTTLLASLPQQTPRTSPAVPAVYVCANDARDPGPAEQELRAMGERGAAIVCRSIRWAQPEACFTARRAAVGIIGDLAPTESIPDLIELLADSEPEVRSGALTALHRLSGRPARIAAQCSSDTPQVIQERQAEWRKWWELNRASYERAASVSGVSERIVARRTTP